MKPRSIISTGFQPRPWQQRVIEMLKRFSVIVVHRRGGKTVLAVNLLVAAALASREANGRFAYLAPFVSQSRRIAWPYVRHYLQALPGVTFNETLAQATLPNGSTIALYGADNPDALRGLFFDGIVLDEVADMRPHVWGEIIRPALTDRQGWAVFIGTPKGLNLFSELYYRALRDPEWFATRLTVNETESLPVEEVERARQEMTERQFAQEMLCDFEAAAEDALVSLQVAREAAQRVLTPEAYQHAPKILGIDVARYGDDSTVIAKRQGLAAIGHRIMQGADTMTVAGAVAAEAASWDPDAIFVDVGGVGAGVVDRLQQLGHDVIAVDFGSRPIDPRFANKRAEMWWATGEWLEHACIPNDERLIADLCAPRISYANAAGKLQLESKDKMRARGMPSPDIGDAYALTFAMPVAPRGLRGPGRARVNDEDFLREMGAIE